MPAGVKKLARISVSGVVQGVGFRPFVYRLAKEHNLAGCVRNTSGKVEIEAEGDWEAIQRFLRELESGAPPVSHIEKIETAFLAPVDYTGFHIRESFKEDGQYQLVSADIATCKDCQREIFDPANRRFRYPFTNCTNCGPRFTIIEDIPYDRANTTMRSFTMCPDCRREYENPMDRRFHAQPNACPVCGPRLELVDANGHYISTEDAIKSAAGLLKRGKILAIRGLGGFQLACDATNEQAVSLLRTRKRRPAKPFAVMMSNIDEIERHCAASADERRLLESVQSPIVLLSWKKDSSVLAQPVAPNLKYHGVMLPYTPLHHLLLKEVSVPLVMTSGNLSEEPIAKDNDEAFVRLKEIADYFLVHNRDIYARYDDSVFFVEDKQPRALRRARGYAPYPITLPYKSAQILACGAEEKNTFCLTKDEYAFVSQHIGDMENEETLEHFENSIELYKRLFRIKPEVIACDMHPQYLSIKYALETGSKLELRTVPVQHHHAHIVSCMVENRVKEPVIGVAFDGTGYGTDGTIWGGEFLVADWKGFRRAGHLEYVPLPGGAAAIKSPYRMALSYVFTLLGYDISLEGLPLGTIGEQELDIIKRQLKSGINSPLTSSMGRLFDTVSALSGVRSKVDYEAQAAIELEMAAQDEAVLEIYPFGIDMVEGIRIIRLKELFSAIINDIRKKVPAQVISRKFHQTVAQMLVMMCQFVSEETGIKQVALSGGVFQNRLLFNLATESLKRSGFRVITHSLLPCNDGGISLGQAVIAQHSIS